MRIENRIGQEINSVEGWGTLAPPASERHWREYRSAYELAHAWTQGEGRERALALLAPALPGITLERGIAERKTKFDAIPSGPRNHDLLVLAACAAGPIVIGIEGKADEPFDAELTAWLAARVAATPGSRAPERLDGLTRALFGTTLADDPTLGPLRYQLLSALAGTLAEARSLNATAAVLLIHEFTTPLTTARKHAANAAALNAFLRRLGLNPPGAKDWLLGPITVPGNAYLPGDIPIYIAKLHTHVSHRTPATDAAPAAQVVAPLAARRPVHVAVGGGVAVIKLNVHPPGCACGCAGKGGIAFVINRPGEHVRMRHGNDLDVIIRHAHEWAADALRIPPQGAARTSQITVGGGMATILLRVGGTPSLRVQRLDAIDAEYTTDDLAEALTTFRAWAEQAVAGR